MPHTASAMRIVSPVVYVNHTPLENLESTDCIYPYENFHVCSSSIMLLILRRNNTTPTNIHQYLLPVIAVGIKCKIRNGALFISIPPPK
mmetsp:Transcript_6576/g.14284  ORF Transcript_6576/g.14284 Transcript_6576/m.14284 type:complete len:89 (+) Transcript_6576:1305-1571(+)